MSTKISSAQAAMVSARGSSTIRSLVSKVSSLEEENAQLRDKIASMERDREIEELASEMDEKGLNSGLSLDEKIAHIRSYKDLQTVREAVKMASAPGNIRLASVSDDEPGRSATVDSFTEFCVTGQS